MHDGAEHYNRLYIIGERFREIITAANANPGDVLDDLEARGALVILGKKEKERIAQLVTSKGKKRCYAIPLSKLK